MPSSKSFLVEAVVLEGTASGFGAAIFQTGSDPDGASLALGPTGPTGPTGPMGGPTGSTGVTGTT